MTVSRRTAFSIAAALCFGAGRTLAQVVDERLDTEIVPPPARRGPPPKPKPFFGKPYTMAELNAAQQRLGFRFPPDLVSFYLKHRITEGYDWTRDDRKIRSATDDLVSGIVFDSEYIHWQPDWGPRPTTEAGRKSALKTLLARAPKMIPIRGNHYIPETPNAAGNPIFEAVQADIIIIAANLDEYPLIEQGVIPKQSAPIKTIPFWTAFVDRPFENGELVAPKSAP